MVPVKAVIYTRVSSDRSGRGRSVTEQEADCRAVCAHEGWVVADVLVDNDAGASRWSRRDRPAYHKLSMVLRGGGVGVLVTWEASRAQRDLSAYVQLRDLCAERGVLWSYSGRTFDLSRPDDRMTTGLDALLSEREADVTRERVLRALRARVEAGTPHGKVAYGYRRVVDPVTGESTGRVCNETTAPIVVNACRRALTGEPLAAIARDLNDRGVAAPRPGRDGAPVKWTGSQVKRMVVSPTYAALRTHNGVVVGPATWPALVSEADHFALRARLNDPRRLTHKDGALKHLLVGIATCGVCGAVCRRVKNRQTPSYSCSERHCVARAQHFLDEYVTEVVLARLSQPDIRDLIAGDDVASMDSLREARALRARLDTFYDAAAAGEVTSSALARIEATLLPKIVVAERQSASSAISPMLTEFGGGHARAVWEGLGVAQRRELVTTLLTPVILRTQQGARRLNVDDIRIEWKVE